MRKVHVIGAGLAGLNAAVQLTRQQREACDITIYEAAKHAGGRCRSLHEPILDAIVDNGAHLMLSGNTEVWDYLDRIGATDEVLVPKRAVYPFVDVQSGARWQLDLGRGKGQWRLARALMGARGRPAGMGAVRLMRDIRRLRAMRHDTVGAALSGSPAYAAFWAPLALAVLNTDPAEASAELLWQMLTRTVLKGGDAARPLFTRQGLGAALVTPAVETLERAGVRLHFGRRVHRLDIDAGRVRGFDYNAGSDVLGARDAVVLAVPPRTAGELLPELAVPKQTRAILNVHYRVPGGLEAPPMTGIVSGHGHWVFVRGRVATVMLSAADAWMDKDTDAIAHALWPDVARALNMVGDVPPFRVIKERRATIAQTPQAAAMRPDVRTNLENLVLAGDWTATGLPATIEGALLSGRLAAEALIARGEGG